MNFDLTDALIAMFEHALVPLRVKHSGTGLQGHLLAQRSNRGGAFGLVANVDRRCLATLGHFDRLSDTTQGVEVVIDGRDPELD